ncbi:MAG: PCRF domain-containing protein, partial [Proteobacteria bacterium]|nr:PCRF domain-containing protein [Pseudomonadota bacterium]
MIIKRLEEIEKRYHELSKLLSDPKIIGDQNLYQQYSKENSKLAPIIEAFGELKEVQEGLAENRELLEGNDDELKSIAKEELPELQKSKEDITNNLKILLLPSDPNDEKNLLLEIRAGVGGDESTLFCAELFRMYSRYAESLGWKVELLSSSPTGVNGFK